MDESRCNQNTGAKVLAGKEDLGRNLHPLYLLGHNRETGPKKGSGHDKN